MVDVVITYETLFDLLRKEKSREELQQLPEDFYGQLIAYLRQKEADVAAAGGFNAPGSQKALIQYRNVQKILRELYERRERKILEMALNSARTGSNLIDTSALLPQEKSFFGESADLLKGFRASLLTPILDGEVPAGVTVASREEPAQAEEPSAEAEPARGAGAATEASAESGLSAEEIAARDSCAVRFIAAVPKFLGLKGDVLGPYESGDTAELPGKIAAVLYKKRRVELA